MGWWAAVTAGLGIAASIEGTSRQNEAYQNQAKAAVIEAAYNIRAAERISVLFNGRCSLMNCGAKISVMLLSMHDEKDIC